MRRAALFAMLLLVCGCATVSLADPSRDGLEPAAPPAEEAWGRRRVDTLEVLLSADAPPPVADEWWRDPAVLYTDRGALVYETWSRSGEFRLRYLSHSYTAPSLEGKPPTTLDDDTRLSRTELLYLAPKGEPRGLVVHLSSIMPSAAFEASVMRELHRRGWAIVKCNGPTLWDPPRREATPDPVEIEDRLMARYIGRGIGRYADEWIAEWRDAIDAGLAYVEAHHPGIPRETLVFTGYSLGALALPPVAAANPERCVAAVIVAGGAPGSIILQENFGQRLLRQNNRMPYRASGGALDASHWPTFLDAYLEFSFLDPWHTAPALNDVPVLQVHAAYDAIVPAETGDTLHERLGRPERWSYPTGHIGLFWWLPMIKHEIADWIDRTTSSP